MDCFSSVPEGQLGKRQILCPIHWPHPRLHQTSPARRVGWGRWIRSPPRPRHLWKVQFCYCQINLSDVCWSTKDTVWFIWNPSVFFISKLLISDHDLLTFLHFMIGISCSFIFHRLSFGLKHKLKKLRDIPKFQHIHSFILMRKKCKFTRVWKKNTDFEWEKHE